MIYITTSATTDVADQCAGLLIQVNAALTGTITVTDAGTTKAIITNPAVGNVFKYYGFVGKANVTASTTCNITVSILSRTFS